MIGRGYLMFEKISDLEKGLSSIKITGGEPIIRYKQWTQDVEEEIIEGYYPTEEHPDEDKRKESRQMLQWIYDNSGRYYDRYLAGEVLLRNGIISKDELKDKRYDWMESLKQDMMKMDRNSISKLYDLRWMLVDYDLKEDRNGIIEFMGDYLPKISKGMWFFRRRCVRKFLRERYISSGLPDDLEDLVRAHTNT